MHELLRLAPLFQGLSDKELSPFVHTAQRQQFKPGEMLFAAGDVAEAFFLLIKGNVRLYRLSPEGREKVIEIVPSGQTFAEAIVFLNKPYPVFANALDETEVLRIPAKVMLKELHNNSDLAVHMLARLSIHLHKFVNDIHALTLSNAKQRIAGYLLAFIDEQAQQHKVCLPANKATIASRLGLQPETFSRVWSSLKKEEIILEYNDHIVIHSPDALRALLDPS